MRPSAQSGWIGQPRWILAVGRSLLDRIAGGNPFVRLLATAQSVMARGCKPLRQDCEGLLARLTDSAPHPVALALVIVALTESPSMTDDRILPTNWTSPRQAVQRNHPGSRLSFVSGSAINRITAGVKARRDRSLPKSRSAAGPSPSGNVSSERKKNTASHRWRRAPHLETLAGIKALQGPNGCSSNTT
jgi:hypothetical protein